MSIRLGDQVKVIRGAFLAWQGIVIDVYGTLAAVDLRWKGETARATLQQADLWVTEAAERDDDGAGDDDYLKVLKDYYLPCNED
jgi:hypothetical protein